MKQEDTTIKIWDYLFKVKLPYIQSRSIEDLRRYGTTLSGVKEMDEDIVNQWMTTMLSIASMVKYYQEGVPIKVVSYNDTKTIYEFISAHIYAWKQRLENGVNIGEAPIDDLIAMDEFANIVYTHAKTQFTHDYIESVLVRRMHKMNRVSSSFFANKLISNLNSERNVDEDTIKINEDKEEIPERESLSGFFKDRIINFGG